MNDQPILPHQPSVLIIEIDPHKYQSLKEALQAAGYDVFITESSSEALEIIDYSNSFRADVDVILVSSSSSEVDSIEILDRLREGCDLGGTFVFLLTDDQESPVLIQALRAGYDDCFSLPIDPEVCAARITKRLEGKTGEWVLQQEYEDLQKQVKDIDLLQKISVEIGASITIEQLVESLVEGGHELLGVEMATAHLWDERARKFISYVAPIEKQFLSESPRRFGGLTRMILETGEPIIVEDVGSDERVNPGVVDRGIQSLAGFPLIAGGKVIGALFFDSTKKQFFEEQKVNLISMLVSQAAVAIEVVRAFEVTERRAILSREIVGVSQRLTQTLEITEQLKIIEKFLNDEMRAPMFFIGLYNEISNTLNFDVAYDLGKPIGRFAKSLDDVSNWGLSGYVVKRGKSINWTSRTEKEKLYELLGINPDVRGAPSESGMVFPLDVGGSIIGVISIQSDVPDAWDITIRRMVQTLANLVAVAIKNTRLFERIQTDQARMHAALEASKEIASAQDPDETLHAIVRRVKNVTGAWRTLCALVDEIGTVRHVAAEGFDPDLDLYRSIRHYGLSRKVIQSKEARFISNIRVVEAELHPRMVEQGVHSAACLPLIYKEDSIGVLWTHYQEPHLFDQSEQEALSLYANQAAIAYVNARRIRELDHMRQAVGALAGVFSTEEVLHQIVDSARDVLHADSTAIWSYDDISDQFILKDCIATGIPPEIWDKFQNQEPFVGQTALTVIDKGWVGVRNIGDTKIYPFLGENTRLMLGQLGVQSFQGVALKDGQEVLGVLYVNYNHLQGFSLDEKETAITFANHASLALKKAKLVDQLETSHNVARVVAKVSTVGNLKSTMDSIVHGTREALDCDVVTLYSYDEERDEFGFPPAIVGVKHPDPVLGYGFVARDSVPYKIISENKIHVADNTLDDTLLRSPFSVREGIKSSACVPLISHGKKVGVMFVNYCNHHKFTPDEITNLELFANQAAVAIHNAIFYDQVQEHLNTLESLYHASSAISGTLDLDLILGTIVEQAYNIALPEGELTHFSYITWLDDRSYVIKTAYPDENLAILRERFGGIRFDLEKKSGINGRVFRTGEPSLVGDTTKDPDYLPFNSTIHSQLSVPLIIDDKVVAVISVEHSDYNAFDEADLRVLTALADQACLAIRNANQYEELRETRGMVGARTALAWMGMASSTWRHSIVSNAQTIRDRLKLLSMDLKNSAIIDGGIESCIQTIDRKALEILEKPITLPLSAEEGIEFVNVNAFVKGRAEQLWMNDPHRTTDLKYEFDLGEDATIRVSREWVRRVLDILFDNAVEAVETSEIKRVTVGTRVSADGCYEIYVADTGIGIPEHILDHILIDPIEKPGETEGMGMGLLIAKTIVTTYSGEMYVDYTGPEGTCMVIRFPVAGSPG